MALDDTETEERNYNRDMSEAPRDEEILLLLPTGNSEAPLEVDKGWWDMEAKRWEGTWRYMEGEGAYADAEPIGFCEIPDIDDDILDEYGVPIA